MGRAGFSTAWVIVATIAVAVAMVLGWMVWSRTHPDPALLARRAYDRGDWDRALHLLRDDQEPGSFANADPVFLRLQARTLVRLERDATALDLYEGRLKDESLEPEDVFLKGLAMTRVGRLDPAFELWGQSVRSGVDHPEMLDHYSRLAAKFQRMDPALDAARRLRRQPGWEARALFTLASLHEMVDDPPGVVDAMEEAFRLEPEARGALFSLEHYRKLLARNLLRLGRPGPAAEQLKALVATAEGSSSRAVDTEAEWLLSRAYLQQDRMADAAEALGRSGSYRNEHRLTPEPGPYVGESACVPCHRSECRHYEATPHSRTFARGNGLLALPMTERPVPDPDDPGVLHTVERRDSRVEAEDRLGDRVVRMVVEYAFGTPEHYVTMIARDSEKAYRALRISHYRTASASGWGPTAGDVGHSDDPEDRIGQRIDVRDGVVRCLYCHVTRSRDFRDPPPDGGPSPAVADRAIGCERCHGPGGNHVRAVAQDFKDPRGSADFAIVNVDGAPGATANGMCVECHTVGFAPQIEQASDDPKYVRSPGVTFAASRCFTESGGALSCMTCHDPHSEADHSPAFYEARCLDCHPAASGGAQKPPARSRFSMVGKPCPVNPAKDCLGCHMPKVPMPILHKTLTDHYIRVHRDEKSGASSGG